jgi:hypothetical protein
MLLAGKRMMSGFICLPRLILLFILLMEGVTLFLFPPLIPAREIHYCTYEKYEEEIDRAVAVTGNKKINCNTYS